MKTFDAIFSGRWHHKQIYASMNHSHKIILNEFNIILQVSQALLNLGSDNTRKSNTERQTQ